MINVSLNESVQLLMEKNKQLKNNISYNYNAKLLIFKETNCIIL